MKKAAIITLIFVGVLCSSIASNAQETKFTKAFNGKNMEGWVAPNNNIWWTVNDGVLEAKSDSTQHGSILWTEKKYKNFIIKLDFKFGEGTVDSGVFLRTVKEQIQLGESGSMKRDMTASPYIAKKGYPVEAEKVKELLKPNDWNTVKIKADGKVYIAWLNGEKVMTYESETAIEEGPIGLQLHPDRDMSIRFKKIKIGVLD